MMKTEHLFEYLSKEFTYLICTHVNPDLDAVSSLLSLLTVMHSKGFKAVGKLQQEPQWMNFLTGWDLYHELSSKEVSPSHLITLDCGSRDRIWPQNISENTSCIINIDHHFDNPLYGTINICDYQMSSTAELLFTLFTNDELTIDPALASNLYAGILFDTGGFRYSNTREQTFKIASHIIALGVNPSFVAEKVFTNWGSKGFCALQLALSSIEFFESHQILFSFVPYAQISKNELVNADFEGVIDILRLNKEPRFIVLVREIEKNHFKGSVRAKEPNEIGSSLKIFKGGGHKRAAGFSIQKESIDSIKSLLISNLKQML